MPLAKIETRTYGTGHPTVVVLHGGPGAPGSAAGLAHGLSQDFHVIEPLQRRSGGPILTVSQHVEDLAGSCPAKSVIAGHSWGAMLALSFAARFPEKPAALILAGCGTYDAETRGLIEPAVLSRLSAASKERRQVLLAAIKAAPEGEERDKLFAAWGAIEEKASAYDACLDDPAAGALPVDAAGHVQTWNDVLRLQSEGVEPGIFRRIHVPVLMVHGDTDTHPGARTATLLKAYMPQLEYVELGRCGHEPWRERYGRGPFFDILCRWIAAKVHL